MSSPTEETARHRIEVLADDPVCREFLVAYLLGVIPENQWPHMVQTLLEYRDVVAAKHNTGRWELLKSERFPDV